MHPKMGSRLSLAYHYHCIFLFLLYTFTLPYLGTLKSINIITTSGSRVLAQAPMYDTYRCIAAVHTTARHTVVTSLWLINLLGLIVSIMSL